MQRFPTFKEASKITTSNLEFMNFMHRDARKEILEAIISSNYFKSDDGYTNFLIETVLENNLYHKLFEGTLNNEELYPILLERYITESKIKDWFMQKKEQVSKWIEDGYEKAKEKGVQIINKLKSFGDVVKLIKDSVAGFLKAAWDFIKKSVTSNLSEFKDDLIAKWKKWTEHDEEGVVGEVKHFTQMSRSTVAWATSGFPREAGMAVDKVGNEDSGTEDDRDTGKPKEESYTYESVLEQSLYIAFAELIKEDSSIIDEALEFDNLIKDENNTLLEVKLKEFFASNSLIEGDHGHGGFEHLQIPFIGKVIHKLAHVKPFEYLTNIEHWVGENVNNIFHKVSIWVNKFANGPSPFNYSYLGQCAAFTVGAKLKTGITEIVKMIGEASIGAAIASSVPGLAWILTLLKTIASGIWYVEVGQLGISAVSQSAATSIKKAKEEASKPETESEPTTTEEPQQ